MDNTQQVKRNTILAYGGLATPLAMIGYPIAIWLIPFYSEVVGIPLYIIANLLLVARFTDVITVFTLLKYLMWNTKLTRHPPKYVR